MADVVIRVTADGAQAHWTDAIDLRAIGRIQRVERVSVVVFDDFAQEWVAQRIPGGDVIARHPNRTKLLELEAAYFAERL